MLHLEDEAPEREPPEDLNDVCGLFGPVQDF